MEREKIEAEIIQLKAAVYDCWAIKEQVEKKANEVNGKILELTQQLTQQLNSVAEPPPEA